MSTPFNKKRQCPIRAFFVIAKVIMKQKYKTHKRAGFRPYANE